MTKILQPLAEVFGHPLADQSAKATRYRSGRLCPFNNKVPNCTKDKLYDTESPKPVNVASVPQRSPFRYPGGKTWFVPTFRDWIKNNYPKPKILIEPFSGGGIISITALFEELVSHVVMVEIDADVAAVWQAVVNGDAGWLAKRILEFDLTKEAVIQEISKKTLALKRKPFKLF